jgi:hypothetical protein
MVAPSSKTPRIVNADKTAIVKDPGTLVWNNQTDRLEVVDNAFNFVPTGGGGTIPDNVILQQLWVNAASGSDANDGGEYTPFASYAAATAFAALTASASNRFVINLIGDFTEASPVLNPFMDLVFHSGTFTVTGGMSLANSWDTVVNNELVTIQGMKMAGFWSFSWIANSGNIIRFLNCDHGLTTSGNFLSNPGSVNALQIINDTSLAATSYSSSLFVSQSPSVLFNATVAGEIRYDVLTDGYTLDHYLLNSTIPFGIVLKKTVPNTSTQVVHVRNTPMPTGSPVLEDPLCTIEIDTVSYLNDPTILLSGSYADIITKGLNGIRQQLWVNDAVGNDLNNGGLNQPMKTYDAARAAAAAVASPTNRFLINVIGDLTLAGDFNINPYIDLNFINSTVTINGGGGILLDAAWTVSSEKVTINGFKPICAAGLNLTWALNTYVGNVVTFNNPNFAQCPTAFLFSTSYSNLNDNTVCIFNDLNPTPSSFSGGMTVSDIKSRFQGVNFGGDVSYTLFDDDYNTDHYLYNCYVPGTVSVTRPVGNGTQRLRVRNTFIGNPINLDTQGGQVFIDSDSYSQTPVIGGSNIYEDFVLSDITDGILMNTITPTQYSFVSGTYPTNALTGFMKGVDNKLGSLTIPYVETSSLTNVMSPNTEYTANAGSVVSLTLPINAAVGDTIRVNGKGAGGWRIDQQNAGHIIHVGAQNTTLGPTGSLASATQFASVTLRCVTTDNVWVGIAAVGTFTPA